jgi:hypothetical protein
MAYTFEELRHKKVAELRQVAAELGEEVIQGALQMNKEHLLEAICKALNLEMHVHHKVVGVDKAAIKAEIRKLKKQRDAAIAEKKKDELIKTRRKIRNLKKTLRRSIV